MTVDYVSGGHSVRHSFPTRRSSDLVPTPVQDGRIDVAAFWRRLGCPVVNDAAGDTWVLGAGAQQRNDALAGLTAPDFTLPDRSEEHTSELQSHVNLVCRLLLENKHS